METAVCIIAVTFALILITVYVYNPIEISSGNFLSFFHHY